MQNKQTRLANLRYLIRREGAVSQLALRLQISPIYIYRVLDGKFNIGDSMARKIEDSYGYPQGWMDTDHPHVEKEEGAIPTLGPAQRVAIEELDQIGQRREAEVSQSIPARPESAPAPTSRATARAEVAASSVTRESKESALGAPKTVSGRADTVTDRLVSGIINTLERMLVANGAELSEMEKAKLLMKAAERILDERKNTGDSESSSTPVIKISS